MNHALLIGLCIGVGVLLMRDDDDANQRLEGLESRVAQVESDLAQSRTPRPSRADVIAQTAGDAAKLGRYGRAEKLCGDALELDPTHPQALMVCTIAACKLKRGDKAQRHYAQLEPSSQRAVRQLCSAAGFDLPSPG